MTSETKAAIVCVTGAAGFVGAHVCKTLLERGHRVRGTVRSKAPEKVKHLLKLGTEENRIELWVADLLQEGSFDDVISGL
jgi:nucleoside-diphosphate-sugar epimerase